MISHWAQIIIIWMLDGSVFAYIKLPICMACKEILCIGAFPISFFLYLGCFFVFCRKLRPQVWAFEVFSCHNIVSAWWSVLWWKLIFSVKLFVDVGSWGVVNSGRSGVIWRSEKSGSGHVLHGFVLIQIILFDIFKLEALKFGTGNAFVKHFFLAIFFRLLCHRLMFIRRGKGAIRAIFGG